MLTGGIDNQGHTIHNKHLACNDELISRFVTLTDPNNFSVASISRWETELWKNHTTCLGPNKSNFLIAAGLVPLRAISTQAARPASHSGRVRCRAASRHLLSSGHSHTHSHMGPHTHTHLLQTEVLEQLEFCILYFRS